MDTQEFRKSRLSELAKKMGGNTALAKRLGYTNGSHIGNLLNGYRPITEKFIDKTESQLRIPGWFSEEVVDVQGFNPAQPGVVVPLLTTVASMGNGEQVDTHDAIVGTLTLSPNWINENIRPVTEHFNLRFIHASGDSMEPTFKSGDVILVDSGIHTVDFDGIYVLEAQQKLFIKRVSQNLSGQYTITSDNPKVKTVDVLDGHTEVVILGRVLWAWEGKRL
ncbi:S24 family peptidase [Saezia sanguinis]|uniref:S24 family peptidase n=1 Tax=Saezia sanguinis TaxID=1965230 RepID=UPI0030357A34